MGVVANCIIQIRQIYEHIRTYVAELINSTIDSGCFGPAGLCLCMRLAKDYMSKTSCNHLILIDSATYMYAYHNQFASYSINTLVMSLNDVIVYHSY